MFWKNKYRTCSKVFRKKKKKKKKAFINPIVGEFTVTAATALCKKTENYNN